jgi:hypothetical protein
LLEAIPDVPHPFSVNTTSLLSTACCTGPGKDNIYPPTDGTEMEGDCPGLGSVHVRVKRRAELRMGALGMDKSVRDRKGWSLNARRKRGGNRGGVRGAVVAKFEAKGWKGALESVDIVLGPKVRVSSVSNILSKQ